MNFVFEYIDEHGDGHNFINCPDINPCGRPRFSPSSITATIINIKKFKRRLQNFDFNNINHYTVRNRPDRYIISTGVNNHPSDWCGDDGYGNGVNPRNPPMKNLFDWLIPEYLNDLRNKKAFLLLDQTLEGYQTTWLWEWFHNSLKKYQIDPKQIIYVTGNLDSESQYNDWCNNSCQDSKMLVLGYSLFEELTFDKAHKSTLFGYKNLLPSLQDQLSFKKQNLHSIKTYNALQKRPRPHRIWLFNKLYENNLLDNGINSMNDFDIRNSWYEGKTISPESYYSYKNILPIFPYSIVNEDELNQFADVDSGKYQMMFNENIIFNSWVSVISEASFGDTESTCFISEKSFKPILMCHPFIIFGNKNSLKNLKEMGYKTFHPFINETYDTLPPWDRLNYIIHEIKRINSKTDKEKLYWFESIYDILQYNYDQIKKNVKTYGSMSIRKIENHIKN